jgi:hypothetical protein
MQVPLFLPISGHFFLSVGSSKNELSPFQYGFC